MSSSNFKLGLKTEYPVPKLGAPFVDFDLIYREEVDPWEQSGTAGDMAPYYGYSRIKLVRRLAERFNANGSGLEIGCGYGYLTDLLAQKFHMSGVDISPTAIKRAMHLHPGIEFELGDVRAPDFFPGSYHFVILAQLWWYCLDDVEAVIASCLRCLEPNGLLVLSQGFLPSGKTQYGWEIADGFEGALKLLMGRPQLRLIEALYDDTGARCLNDGLIILRKVEHADDDDKPHRRLRSAFRT